jgi:general secretion pathway protein I
MRRRRQGGFTLLEVLVSLSLFALAASAVGALATQSMVRSMENRHGTAAALVAQQELERLRGLPYQDVADGTSSATMGGLTYGITTAVEPDMPAPNMKQITVHVYWSGPEGERSYVVSTIYADVTAE